MAAKPTTDKTVQLAERLFVETWQPHGGIVATAVADMCLAAAEDFYAAAKQRNKPATKSEAA